MLKETDRHDICSI